MFYDEYYSFQTHRKKIRTPQSVSSCANILKIDIYGSKDDFE